MKHIFSLFFLSLLAVPLLQAQERLVTVEGLTYRIKTGGEGKVTVIFENGMSDSLEVWGSIPDSIASSARYFLYDRADIGKSDTSRSERTLPNQVTELRSILADQKISPPYVLVGHSLGGLLMRYYAANYPAEVKGLLLFDPAPESFWEKMSAKELKEYVEGGNEWYETRFEARYRKEWYQFIPNLGLMKKLRINPELPVILVSATAWEWYAYHEDILKGYRHTKHIELEGTHYIFSDHPDRAVSFIRELLADDRDW